MRTETKKKLTKREFISALNSRLDAFAHGDLKAAILHRAQSLPSGERRRFLDIFRSPPESKRAPSKGNDLDLLLQEIREFGQRTEAYEYSDGWGWDHDLHDERAWGDESWTDEVDAFFDSIDTLYFAREFAGARQAFEALFDVFWGGVEEGQLPGNDPEEMIDTDLDESAAKYLRCVYLTETISDRSKALYKAISQQYYTPHILSIEGMIDADSEDLPDMDRFASDWQVYLTRKGKGAHANHLLREAARLFADRQGLERLALEKGKMYPGLFVEWLIALEGDGSHKKIIDAALIGLETLPKHLKIRAGIADRLRKAATVLRKKKLILKGLRETFYASPSVERLLDFVDSAKSKRERLDLIEGALNHFGEMEKRSVRSSSDDFESSPDLAEVRVNEDLITICHILKGDYTTLSALMDRSDSLGWYYGDNPNRLVVPFFLFARWNREKPVKANLTELLESMASSRSRAALFDILSEFEGELGAEDTPTVVEPQKRLAAWLDRTLTEIPISEQNRESFFLSALKAVEKRVQAIVGGKHRKSYWKAAQLIAAVAETEWNSGRMSSGQALIEKYMKKFNRHRAFKTELTSAVNKSQLDAVST